MKQEEDGQRRVEPVGRLIDEAACAMLPLSSDPLLQLISDERRRCSRSPDVADPPEQVRGDTSDVAVCRLCVCEGKIRLEGVPATSGRPRSAADRQSRP